MRAIVCNPIVAKEKIFQPVVCGDKVDVVDLLGSPNASANMLLNDMDMLKGPPATPAFFNR